MSDNVNAARSAHRKTFSFLSSSWFPSKLSLQPFVQRSTDRESTPQEHRVDEASTSAPPTTPTSSNHTNLPRGPSPSPFSRHLPARPNLSNMRLARKVKNFGRDAGENAKPKQRGRVGDMLEDPYSLMTMAPSLLVPPSPSPTTSSLVDSERAARSLKRSATVGNQPIAQASSQSAGVHRARSLAALPSQPSSNHTTQSDEPNLSPVVFAPREETSQPQSETSSAFYSESLVPSKAPSLIDEEEELPSPVSEVPTTAASESHRFRNISSDSNGEKSHARLASAVSKAATARSASQDRHPVDIAASSHEQEPSGSSSSSQQAPPLIRCRPPSPQGIAILEGDLLTNPPKRSLSLRRAQTPRSSRRRLSLDIRNLSPEPSKGGASRLKKSRSASASSHRPLRPDAVDELVDSYLSENMDGPVDPEDDKQHAMNVRRAKKMMQLFGDKPPKELFQIRSHRMRDDTIDTISILTTVSENRRDSRATFTSVTSSISIHRRLRDSLQSSNSDPPSPLVFSGNSSESRHGTPEEAKDSDPVEAQPKAEPEPQVETETETAPPVPEQDTAGPADTTMSPRRPSVHSRPGTPSPRASDPRARPTLASLDLVAAGSYSHSRSHSRTHSRNHSLHSQRPLSPEPLPPLPTSPRSPISGAPFSDLVPSQPPVPTNDAGVDPEQAEREREGQDTVGAPPENFRARRIRAAKLSRFFGVAPHDLTGVLASAPPASPTLSVGPYSLARGVHEGRPKTPRQDMSSSFEHSGAMSSTPSLPSHAQSERSKSRERPSITVEVAAEVPRPFRLGREKRPAQELDMEAVLNQLRRMR